MSITASMAQRRRHNMDEHTYKVLGSTGAVNIAFGVIAIVMGIASGVLLIISGAKLLGSRKKVII